MTDFKKKLDDIVEAYLTGLSTFEVFERAYSGCYIDEEADRDFSVSEVDYYGDIHEKAEWTSLSPTAEDREVGWLDEAEFCAWLLSHRRNHRISA